MSDPLGKLDGALEAKPCFQVDFWEGPEPFASPARKIERIHDSLLGCRHKEILSLSIPIESCEEARVNSMERVGPYTGLFHPGRSSCYSKYHQRDLFYLDELWGGILAEG